LFVDALVGNVTNKKYAMERTQPVLLMYSITTKFVENLVGNAMKKKNAPENLHFVLQINSNPPPLCVVRPQVLVILLSTALDVLLPVHKMNYNLVVLYAERQRVTVIVLKNVTVLPLAVLLTNPTLDPERAGLSSAVLLSTCVE